MRPRPDRASAEGLREALFDCYVLLPPERLDLLRDETKQTIDAAAALRDTGPRPDSDAVLLANAILGGSSYLPHREAAERILARDTGPRPDSGIEHALHYDPSCEECAYLARPVMLPRPDTETSRVCVHGTDASEECPECGFALSTPRTETSEPTRAQVEQAFIDGSVEGSPIDHDGTPRTETSDY